MPPRRQRRRLPPDEARKQLEALPATAPYWERLPLLRDAVELSQAELFRRVEDVGFDTVRALEQPWDPPTDGRRARARYPSADTLEKIAAALEVDPAVFPEYRLAKARELLDERQAGLGETLAHLDRITEALRQSAQRSATGAAQRAARRRKLQATPDAEQSQGGGE